MKALPTNLLGLATAFLGCVGASNAAQVTLMVREAGRTEPLPARVHLQDSSRQPVKPPGSPAWHDHFVCAGSVEVALTSGEYRVEIDHGPEFSSVATNFTVGGGARRTSASRFHALPTWRARVGGAARRTSIASCRRRSC